MVGDLLSSKNGAQKDQALGETKLRSAFEKLGGKAKSAIQLLALLGLFLSVSGSLFIENGFSTKVYLGLILPGLVLLAIDAAYGRSFWQACLKSPGFWLVFAFLAFVSVSGLAVGDGTEGFVRTTCIFVYVLTVAYLVDTRRAWVEVTITAATLVAAVLICYGAVVFYQDYPLVIRLAAFGIDDRNPITVGIVAGGFSLMAMVLGHYYKSRILLAILLYAAAAGLVTAAILSGSKTVFLGLGAVAIVYSFQRRKVFPVLLVVGLLAATFAGTLLLNMNERLFDIDSLSTMSDRLPIWLNTLNDAMQNPWFGVGLGYEAEFRGDGEALFEHPHSLYLQALYFCGVVGLILYLAIYAYHLKVSLSLKDDCLASLAGYLLVYVAAVQAVDVHSFLSRPDMYWFLLWMPFGLILLQGVERTPPRGAYE